MTTLTEHRVRIPSFRDAVLIEGPAGWGEWSPLPGYPSDPMVCRRAAEEAATVPMPTPVRSRVRAERDLTYFTRGRFKPAQIPGTLRREPHATIDCRCDIMRMRASRH